MTESIGPVPFSTEYLICRYVQMYGRTDRQTDELIRVGLGNLSVPPGILTTPGPEEHVRITLIFSYRNHQFHILFSVILSLMYFFYGFLIHDSRGFMILKKK